MKTKKFYPKTGFESSPAKIVVSFVIPIIILSKFSEASRLGPTKALLLALAFPIAYEIYSLITHKKLSIISIVAIAGILVTGVMSLLGLSESWLAIRRSLPYGALSIATLVCVWANYPFLKKFLVTIFDMDTIHEHTKRQNNTAAFEASMRQVSYLLAGVFLVVAIASYILTRVVIVSQPLTATYNHEYARLRVLSLPFITLPLLVGIISITAYFVRRLEKLTSLEAEHFMKKR